MLPRFGTEPASRCDQTERTSRGQKRGAHRPGSVRYFRLNRDVASRLKHMYPKSALMTEEINIVDYYMIRVTQERFHHLIGIMLD